MGILLDTSGSQQNVLPLEQQAGAAFLSRVLRSKDEAFLISFDVNLDLLSDYTSNAHALAHAMDQAQINVGTGGMGGMPSGTPKGTLLYDAVYSATHEKLQQETGRKAIIILTDGEDQGSVQKLEGAVEAAPGRAAGDILPIEGPDREQDRVGGRPGKTLMLKNRYRYRHRRAGRRPNSNRVGH